MTQKLKTRDFTVDDIWQLLQNNGAGYEKESPVRILKVGELFQDKKSLQKLQKLGKGGFGQVYVINIQDMEYALKVMQQQKGETQQNLIDNFYNECKGLLSVNHKRILRMLGVMIDTSEEDDYLFCHYTNYQQKGNLYTIIKDNQLFPDTQQGTLERFIKKLKLLEQIAEGIQAIHNVGFIHRDIKSLNILLDENDSPKIADLGMSRDEEISVTQSAKGTPQ